MVDIDPLELARTGNIAEAEQALMACLDDPQASFRQWPEIIERIVKATTDDSAETLAWAAQEAIRMRVPALDALPYCSHIFRLFSRSDEFRTTAVELYREAFPDHPGLETLIDLSGLRGGKPIRRALQTLDLCLALQPGMYLANKHDSSAARVCSLDLGSSNVRLETPAGEELFDPVSLGDQFELTEEHDFRVLQQFDPQGFADRLLQNPAELVLSIVKAHDNEITSDYLEQQLSPRFIAAEQWSKWWTRARSKIKKHPHIKLEGRNPVIISYEEHVRPLEEELWPKFNVHSPPKAWLDLGQQYLRECKVLGQVPEAAFLLKLRDAAAEQSGTRQARGDAQALSAWLAVSELSRLAGQPADHAQAIGIINQHESISDAFGGLQAEAFWAPALACVREGRPQTWCEDFSKLIPIAPPSRCDALVRAIAEAGQTQLLNPLAPSIMAEPLTHINGLCWLYQGPQDAGLPDIPPLITLIAKMFSVLEQVADSTTMPADMVRDVRTRIRATLGAKKCQRFRECLEQIDVGMGDALRNRLRRSVGLADAVTMDLLNCIRARFPILWHKPTKKLWEDDSILFCTQAGFRKKHAELEELVNVKMRENAIAIGRAAEHGDLSENSEYKFALEERDLLRSRVAEIQNQLSSARVMHRDEITVDQVHIGTRVHLRHRETGNTLTLTFLGPWEADVEADILNYRAPISQQLMGLRVGQDAEFEFKGLPGRYEVTAIECGVD